MLRNKVGVRVGAGIAGLTLAAALIAPAAFGHASAAPKLIGSPAAGKALFTTTCGTCHTLKAAKTAGTIGPDLDKAAAPLTEALIIKAITNGGATIMTKSAAAKYPVTMVAFGGPNGALTATKINNIAAFVYSSTHK
jgi:mono/diheme cytochrome c family protein